MTEFLTALCSGLISGVIVAVVQTALNKSNKFFDIQVVTIGRIAECQSFLQTCSGINIIDARLFESFCQKLDELRISAWVALSSDEQQELSNALVISNDVLGKIREKPEQAELMIVDGHWLDHCNVFASLSSLLDKVDARCKAQVKSPFSYWLRGLNE